MLDLSVVTLAWNSEAYLGRCLDSLSGQCASEALDYEIIVVDNGSSDGSARIVADRAVRLGDRLSLISLDRNRGTTYSRNLAFGQARGRDLCVIDSDTEILSGPIRPILRLIASDDRIGIVAPRLVLPDGSVQHSVKRFPTLLDKLRKLPSIVAGRPAARTDFYPTFPFETCTRVETAISACWFLRADLLAAVGMLDEGILYAPEDVEYSARIIESGRHILYWPHLTIRHHTQQLTHRRPFSVTSLSHVRGLLRYYRRHGGWVSRPDRLAGGLPAACPAAEQVISEVLAPHARANDD
jgi:GT2 family glycosyltransferase